MLVSLGVGLGAVNTGNNLLYLVLGLMLSMLLVSGVLSDLVLVGLRVERLAPRRLFAGRPAQFEVVVHNRKRVLPSLSIEVADVAERDGESTPGYFLRIARRDAERRVITRVASRRGVLRLSGVALRTRYPFGLIEKGRVVPIAGEIVVFPAILPVDDAELERLECGEERPSRRAGPGVEIVGVRAYRWGDEARDIHWRKSASAGALVVREREREARALVSLVLDNRRPKGGDGEWDAAFERAISEAASLARVALSKANAVEVITASGASPRVAPGEPIDPLLRYLALLEPATEGAPAPSTPRTR